MAARGEKRMAVDTRLGRLKSHPPDGSSVSSGVMSVADESVERPGTWSRPSLPRPTSH